LRKRTKHILATVLFAIIWIVAVGSGLHAMLNYESAPGRVGVVPPDWPAGSVIHPVTDRATLVVLAHPRCPCTRATIGELAQIMASAQGKVSAYVLFLQPKGSGSDWQETSLMRTAAAIPGVTVLADMDGVEARRFGAATSGHTLLFDPAGRLLFSGGITQSRGHAGGNAGESAIVALIEHGAAGQHQTPVFGCALAENKQQLRSTMPCQK
jgi:hypothetical protein